jgi:Golgi phosphoprotein 3
MATSGGLSRRRVGGNGGGMISSYDDDDDNKLGVTNGGGGGGGGGGSRSTTPPLPLSVPTPHHAHAGSAFEGGNKIAFDPRDLQQDASEEARTGGKMPRLTIMEEVLLLGIKDKQVNDFLFLYLLTYISQQNSFWFSFF